MTIKDDFELPLFAQNKTYSIDVTKDRCYSLRKKRDDFWTHYLHFNFTFYYKGRPQKSFPFQCYVSTVRLLDETVIISDPSFYKAKKKMLLLIQVVQHIESSGTSSDKVQKLLQIKNDTSSSEVLNNNTEALDKLDLGQPLNDVTPFLSLNDNTQKILEKKICKFEWIKDCPNEESSASILPFTASPNKTDNDFILTLSNEQQCYSHPLSKQEFDLFLMQHLGVDEHSESYIISNVYSPWPLYNSSSLHGILDDQLISIEMSDFAYQIKSMLDKDHTKASIGLHLQQAEDYYGVPTYTITVKKNFKLPLFAKKKTSRITAPKDVHHNLTTKRNDFLTHYLCFNFIFFHKGKRRKSFPVECYVSTVRALNKRIIISDPSFYETKKKIFLLLQAVQYIESSGTLSDEVQKLLQIKNDTSSPKILNNNTEALVELELEQRLNDIISCVRLNDNVQQGSQKKPHVIFQVLNYINKSISTRMARWSFLCIKLPIFLIKE